MNEAAWDEEMAMQGERDGDRNHVYEIIEAAEAREIHVGRVRDV